MLREFEIWLHAHTDYQSVYNKNELSDSMVIDFENDNYIARFTVWDDLSCMSEVMFADSGEYKLNKRNEFSNFEELLHYFKVFSESVK